MLIFHFFHPSHPFKSKSSRSYLEDLALKHGWGEVTYSKNGKPLLAKGHVSISHAKNHLVIAYDPNQALGVDLEYPREITQTLIQRLRLNPKDPLQSWCKKEALIKLLDDPSYLHKAIDPNVVFTQIETHPKALLICASHQTLKNIEQKIIHLNPND